MTDFNQPPVEPSLISVKAPVQLQKDNKSSIAKVVGATTDKTIKAISEAIFVYGEEKKEYTPIKIEVNKELNIESEDLICNLTLISERDKQITLQVNAKCKVQNGEVVVEFGEVKEVKTDFESETTWFLNLFKQFQLLGPWIDFPPELVGEPDPVREAKTEASATESKPTSESEE
jgi:hypothetical protein